MSTEIDLRRQTLLLAIIAFLMVTNTLAVVLGGLWVRSELAQLTQKDTGPIAALTENLQNTRRMAQEVTDRQAAVAAGLDEVARRTAMEMKALQERRVQLGGLQRGPMDKFDQMIGLMQLMADELAVMVKHFTATQGVLAKNARPGELQRELVGEPPSPAKPDAGTK